MTHPHGVKAVRSPTAGAGVVGTASVTSEEEIRVRWGFAGKAGGGGFFKGKRPLDVWIYERRGVELVFDDGDPVAWKTDKTVQEPSGARRKVGATI